MRIRIGLVAAALALLLAAPAMVQESSSTSGTTASAPKPPPEMDQLKWQLGTWQCDEKHLASSLGPAHEERWSETTKPDLSGFWYVTRGAGEKSADTPNGGDFLDIDGYDPVKKKFIDTGFFAGGYWTETYDNGIDGPYTGTSTYNGKTYQTRGTSKHKSDSENSWVGESQIEGKWTKTEEGTCKKQ